MRRYRAYLDGRALNEISGVVVLGVSESAAEWSVNAFPTAADGSHAVNSRRGTMSVQIAFAIKTRDLALRTQAISEVIEWARGSVLETNYRPGQRLRVECTQLPAVNAPHAWNDTLTVAFTAHDVPYWEAVDETNAGGQGTDINLSMIIPGNGETVLSARMEVVEPLSNITIEANGTVLNLIRLSAVEGDIIHVGHDDFGRLFLRKNEENIFYRRLASSDDEVRLLCGKPNDIRITADGALKAEVYARGRWL